MTAKLQNFHLQSKSHHFPKISPQFDAKYVSTSSFHQNMVVNRRQKKLKSIAASATVIIANSLLTYNILSSSIDHNSYYKYCFFISSLLYALAISRYKIMLIIYISSLYILKIMTIHSIFDIHIIVILYIHFLVTMLFLMAINIIFLFYKYKLCDIKCLVYLCTMLFVSIIFAKLSVFSSLSIDEYAINEANQSCIFDINNSNIMPLYDILPMDKLNFFSGNVLYKCMAKKFSFINFKTNELIINCHIKELKIYFGTNYLTEYERISKQHFEDYDLPNWKNKFIKNLSFPYHLIETNESHQDIHKINIISLSNILRPNQELISIDCGDITNTHFIPQNSMYCFQIYLFSHKIYIKSLVCYSSNLIMNHFIFRHDD